MDTSLEKEVKKELVIILAVTDSLRYVIYLCPWAWLSAGSLVWWDSERPESSGPVIGDRKLCEYLHMPGNTADTHHWLSVCLAMWIKEKY